MTTPTTVAKAAAGLLASAAVFYGVAYAASPSGSYDPTIPAYEQALAGSSDGVPDHAPVVIGEAPAPKPGPTSTWEPTSEPQPQGRPTAPEPVAEPGPTTFAPGQFESSIDYGSHDVGPYTPPATSVPEEYTPPQANPELAPSPIGLDGQKLQECLQVLELIDPNAPDREEQRQRVTAECLGYAITQ